jgi:hypothetical protein
LGGREGKGKGIEKSSLERCHTPIKPKLKKKVVKIWSKSKKNNFINI